MNPRLATLRIAGAAIAMAVLVAAARVSAADYQWSLPVGFPEPLVPADNPMSLNKVALGRALFADPRLSMSGRHSCRSCHDPQRAFTHAQRRSRGAAGDELPFNAPTLLNAAYNPSQGWREPAIRTLEQQMLGPLLHPQELGLKGREAEVEQQLAADADMQAAFRAAFPDERQPVTFGNLIRAIAAFERTLIAGSSAFDRYVFRGEHDALNDAQKRGMALFFSARTGCASCHGGINFSGAWVDREHPHAAPAFADTGDGAVRVPTLRNVSITGPYLHDGLLPTLEAVLERYELLARDPRADTRLRRPPLTTEEIAALRDFLRALQDQSP